MPASSSLMLNDKDKKNQGLRQFSLRVCRQVEAKMTTTYNEVADELVKEFKDEETDSDEKNIRRWAGCVLSDALHHLPLCRPCCLCAFRMRCEPLSLKHCLCLSPCF